MQTMTGLTDLQRELISKMTDKDGERDATNCGDCGRSTPVHIDGEGKAWWLCGDCLARRLDDLMKTKRG